VCSHDIDPREATNPEHIDVLARSLDAIARPLAIVAEDRRGLSRSIPPRMPDRRFEPPVGSSYADPERSTDA
jgi:hypothetical protein